MWRLLIGILLVLMGAALVFMGFYAVSVAGFAGRGQVNEYVNRGIWIGVGGGLCIVAGAVTLWRNRRRREAPRPNREIPTRR